MVQGMGETYRKGELVVIVPVYPDERVRGWSSYPGVYGYHKSIDIYPGTVGLVLSKKGMYYQLFVDPHTLWVIKDNIAVVRAGNLIRPREGAKGDLRVWNESLTETIDWLDHEDVCLVLTAGGYSKVIVPSGAVGFVLTELFEVVAEGEESAT